MPHTLLLADDSGTTHRAIELTFAEQGVRVVSVPDGEQAVEKLSTERPDIILAAAVMPKLDGYELASFVKRQPSLCGIPVLLLAGAFDTVDDERLRACGAAGVLVKPFEPAVVLTKVNELLGIDGDAARPTPDSDEAVTEVDREWLGASSVPKRAVESVPLAPSVPPAPAREIADAFAALLAAEQGEPMSDQPALAIELDEEVIDRVATRVADKLSHSLLTNHMTRIVSDVAERVVREEIARIRAEAQKSRSDSVE